MELHSSKKIFFKGTHRAASLKETKEMVLRKIKHSKLPVFDQIIDISSYNKCKIPVYAITHSKRFGKCRLPGWKCTGFCCSNCRLPSWGKGLTDDAALVSGLMERVERYTASDIFSRESEIIFSDYHGLKNKGAISRWDFVPCNLQRKLYSKKEIDKQTRPWVRCFSLTMAKDVLVPANLVFSNGEWCQNDFFDTSGLASGNSIEEAVVQALCEVIERHLEDVVSWNKVKVPTVLIESVQDKGLIRLIKKLQTKEDLEVWISYLTGNFKIPAIRVFAYPRKPPYLLTLPFYSAVGVHPDKNVALSRALTELIQSRACALYRMENNYDKPDSSNCFPREMLSFYIQTLSDNIISFDKIKTYQNLDNLDDIKLITGLLHRLGAEIIIKDLTHPQIDISTVRVLATRLQPGILGISLPSLDHKVARITPHLDYYNYLKKNIKKINF